jgi:Xaa-Pro aminopeptidase
LDGSKSTLALREQVQHLKSLDDNSPIAIPKAIKNDAEVQGFQKSSLRDSVALINFFSWLEEYLLDDSSPPISETQAADKLLEFRQYVRNYTTGNTA